MKRISTNDHTLTLIQDNVAQALQASSAMAGGVVLGSLTKPLALVSGQNVITHGLRRTPQYWTLLDTTGAATVYRVASDAKTLTLNASAPTNVIIWVN